MSNDKVSILGCGAIGSSLAFALALRRPGLRLQLWGRNEAKTRAKAFDLSHCRPLGGVAVGAGSLDDCALSDVVVLTAGCLPKADGKRSDVLGENIGIYRDLVPRLAKASPGAVFIVVTNPVDAMTFAAQRLSGLSASRVLGSGTLLDCLRLRHFAAEAFGLEPGAVEAEVVGEHGDTMLALWSRVRVGGLPLERHLASIGAELGPDMRRELLGKTKRAGWEIRLAGEHSCYAISLSVLRIIEAILDGDGEPLCVSSLMSGEYGIDGLCMSLPSVLGRTGLVSRLAPPLPADELSLLRASAATLAEQTGMVRQFLG